MEQKNIRALFNDLESDRVERTISTTNTDKLEQVICAFANNLSDHRQPGYLFLGVKDDGMVQGCHRDYNSNDPIQFYQYEDCIEIMNHGGLYGRANEANFPNVNDYRNIVVAEAMKVLGFVNRHSRGVLKVQKDLMTNENGMPEYDFSYQTSVLVRKKKSLRGDRMMEVAIENGYVIKEVHEKETHKQKRPEKRSSITTFEFLPEIVKEVYKAIKLNRKAKYAWLSDNLGVSEATIKRAISELKNLEFIDSEHSKVKGEWQLLK